MRRGSGRILGWGGTSRENEGVVATLRGVHARGFGGCKECAREEVRR